MLNFATPCTTAIALLIATLFSLGQLTAHASQLQALLSEESTTTLDEPTFVDLMSSIHAWRPNGPGIAGDLDARVYEALASPSAFYAAIERVRSLGDLADEPDEAKEEADTKQFSAKSFIGKWVRRFLVDLDAPPTERGDAVLAGLYSAFVAYCSPPGSATAGLAPANGEGLGLRRASLVVDRHIRELQHESVTPSDPAPPKPGSPLDLASIEHDLARIAAHFIGIPKVHYARSLAAAERGDYTAAVDALNTFVSTARNDRAEPEISILHMIPWAAYALAQMHAKFGWYERAMQLLEACIRDAQNVQDAECTQMARARLQEIVSIVNPATDRRAEPSRPLLDAAEAWTAFRTSGDVASLLALVRARAREEHPRAARRLLDELTQSGLHPPVDLASLARIEREYVYLNLAKSVLACDWPRFADYERTYAGHLADLPAVNQLERRRLQVARAQAALRRHRYHDAMGALADLEPHLGIGVAAEDVAASEDALEVTCLRLLVLLTAGALSNALELVHPLPARDSAQPAAHEPFRLLYQALSLAVRAAYDPTALQSTDLFATFIAPARLLTAAQPRAEITTVVVVRLMAPDHPLRQAALETALEDAVRARDVFLQWYVLHAGARKFSPQHHEDYVRLSPLVRPRCEFE
ncbi:anaphase promoting complex subunit 5 [Blastocladiella emersonii ATCC 22665]|nr:anaphase promoting complex subunit 5 [Blastocladiella emersonii ATCC 22665]